MTPSFFVYFFAGFGLYAVGKWIAEICFALHDISTGRDER